ncbi:hypothetical protein OOT46_08865 [Aquabacterium sp. A7-Y]|uniref:hypothetical protein n=1 Tax=Aquabacterium sp. A7-Y TaxID=1349605 RepID=UPI00223D1A2C|nr:hypothetical protein [Aquabacterium sp. A7-Y]MCW7537960.1 hypothetical protein [Aquabacterium sp. A7-Y]
MKRPAAALALAFAAVAAPPLAAAAPSGVLQPGHYVTEGGWGHLTLQRSKGRLLDFSISSVGTNAHTCEVDGEVGSRGETTLVDDGPEPLDQPSCKLSFRARGPHVEVRHNGADSCRNHCGARARFDGLYLQPQPGCLPAQRRKAGADFKRLYDAKDYRRARATLEPVFKSCAQTMDRFETGWLRNDLALTLYKLGDRAGCLRLLQPLAADAAKSDTELREASTEPMLVDSLIDILRATRTNLRLCEAQGRPAP